MKSRWLFGIAVALVILPTLAFAAHRAPNTNIWKPSILAGPLVVCGAPVTLSGSGSTANSNGCQNLCDLVAEIIQVLYFAMGLGLWIFIPILFVWGGIKMMLARGNPAKASEARKVLTGAVVGVLIMVCAWLIVSTFVHFLGLGNAIPFFGTGSNNICT